MNQELLNEARTVIAGFFHDRRKELKITQPQLAEATGIGVATIRRFESGKHWLNLKQLLLIMQVLELRPFFISKEADNPLNQTFTQVIESIHPTTIHPGQSN